MNTNRRHVLVFLGSLLVAAALSGVAAAGNPHGTAPGQAKQQANQQSAGATQSTHVHANVHTKGSAHVRQSTHVKGSARVKGSASVRHQSTVTSSSSAGNAVGVKSSSTTGFNTFAAAGSSSTKLYGNGKTAGQIAEQNGAGASTMLFGPGNSQPHKAVLCSSGRIHMVDVHALKAHGVEAASCTAAQVSAVVTASTSVSASGTLTVHGKGHVVLGAKVHGQGRNHVNHVKGAFKLQSSGVLGARHTVTAQARPAHAVVGTANFTG
jgi:hypothetical protein